MHRQQLFDALDRYERKWLSKPLPAPAEWTEVPEKDALVHIRKFVNEHESCFLKENKTGHVTGSALITTPNLEQVLLTLHRKLNKWLQLGGHADGEADISAVALREAQEESGLHGFKFFAPDDQVARTPFDVDIHLIPARYSEPEHKHYDIRYLLIATDNPERIQCSEESHDLRWFSLREALALTSEESMTRQLKKLMFLKKHSIPQRYL